ncbi:hypothetical protein QMA12_09875 [Pseudoalteromonas sp. APC 3893]|nr:hypothetical protein [Pseudoalteromonas sp. APC 3893]
MQQLLISDANILIDMEEGELLTQLFQLPRSKKTCQKKEKITLLKIHTY